ncbi:hypothetical protein [Massilia sp. DD77]
MIHAHRTMTRHAFRLIGGRAAAPVICAVQCTRYPARNLAWLS